MTSIAHDPTPNSTLAETDPRALFSRAVVLAGDVIASVRPDQLDDPTPCSEWDVRTLLAHLVTVLHRVGALGRGEDPFALPPVVVADDGWVEAWFDAAHEVQAAWSDDATLERFMRLPWAELPGAGILASYTSEVTLHTWDLATATGTQPAWDERVLQVAFEASRRSLPAEDRCGAFKAAIQRMPEAVRPRGAPFGEAVEVAADAPLLEQLVAWSGRRP